MGRYSRSFASVTVGAICITLAGCAGEIREQDNLVAVPAIIGSLKCAFAEAVVKESRKGQIERLRGRVAAGTLTLKIVDDTKIGASLKGKAVAKGPFVFAMTGGVGSILPSFSSSVQRTDTIETKISFRYLLAASDDRACDLVPDSTRAKYGFSQWLGGVISGLDFNARTQPRGQIDKLEYNASFGVVNTDSAGLDFDVIFLSGNVSDTSTRSDIQSIAFTIAPVSKTNPAPKKGSGGGLGPADPL